MAHDMHPTAEQEAHGLQPRQYILIGVFLTVITVIELAISYSDIGNVMVPILLVLSAIKFGVVVGYFMHLRFDSPVFAQAFVGSLALASAILVVLITLFWTDTNIIG